MQPDFLNAAQGLRGHAQHISAENDSILLYKQFSLRTCQAELNTYILQAEMHCSWRRKDCLKILDRELLLPPQMKQVLDS